MNTPFDSLEDNAIEFWIDKAEQLVLKQGWAFEEFDRAELLYKTALYLYSVDGLLLKERKFPCYVVHCVEDDSRFETASHEVAFRHFKRMQKGRRTAIFHWPDKHTHERINATPDYPFTRDYGASAIV